MKKKFSYQTRVESIKRFQEEEFDLLIIGGGITGASTARDAASRGLKVALVEKDDFAQGTSSRSSKLIHGGLRYLENFEFALVFEALAERSLLLKTVPHLVRPLEFYLPVYEDDPNGMFKLNAGLWLYDLLSLLRTPGTHKRLSSKKMKEKIPFLFSDGLKGGFKYYDASMWDDVLAIETLKSAHGLGAVAANYVEAKDPIWTDERITGFRCRDGESEQEFDIRAKKVIVCAGPWTDRLGAKTSENWRNWLSPSKGVHLVFSLDRIPIPGAMVMSHPSDGRISFVIPRTDYGAGVVIVGTTDSQTPSDPQKAAVEKEDVTYLMDLLNRYFPSLELTPSDILSAYVGVRPLVGPQASTSGSEGQVALQKVSREHHIDSGPGGTVFVAGGKYTTSRAMAEEIVDFTLKDWKRELKEGKVDAVPQNVGQSETRKPLNEAAISGQVDAARIEAERLSLSVPKSLWERYGSDVLDFVQMECSGKEDPEGFPLLENQLRHLIRTEMVLHLDDFFFRRLPLYLARKDHGKPWIDSLTRVWADERGISDPNLIALEKERLRDAIRDNEIV